MLAKKKIKKNLLGYFYVFFYFNLYKWCEIYSYFVRWKYKNESSSEWMMGEINQQNVMLVDK
jgi:hypothetical protein